VLAGSISLVGEEVVDPDTQKPSTAKNAANLDCWSKFWWLSYPFCRVYGMEPKIWTAAELDAMTPAERQRIFDESIVWDLEDAPAGLVDRARQKALKRIAETEGRKSA